MELIDKKNIKTILSSNDTWFKKSMGQNFLIDADVLAKIIKTSGIKKNDVILEIGPGLGVLTRELCLKAKKVITIEKDEKLLEILKVQMKDHKNLEIINQDVLQTTAYGLQTTAYGLRSTAYGLRSTAYGLRSTAYKLVANLPYNITSPILRKFLTGADKPYLIVVMVQREVAERICSPVGQMSILSVMVQFYGKPKIVSLIESSSFFPEPRVQSAILKIDKIKPKVQVNEEKFFRCVKIGFASRRKTLLNNLSAGYRIEKEQVKDILGKMNLKQTIRAQELSIDEWIKLSKLMGDR